MILTMLATFFTKEPTCKLSEMENVTSFAEDEENGVQKSMEYVFEVVLLSVVGAFGLVGNVSAVALFSRQGIQLKFHRLMMMLATFDFIYIMLR